MAAHLLSGKHTALCQGAETKYNAALTMPQRRRPSCSSQSYVQSPGRSIHWPAGQPDQWGSTCGDCAADTPQAFASTQHALYLLAEDNLPTYKGWKSACSMPVVDQATPPTPCAQVTIGRCTNTPPAAEQVNQQAPPYVGIDLYASAASGPAQQPVKGVIDVQDPVAAAFVQASINSTGSSIVFAFQTSKPGLVLWRLVEQVKVEIANGYVPVRDASLQHEVAVSRKCSGEQLMPGTSYAMWYNMTDVYGKQTDINILKVVL